MRQKPRGFSEKEREFWSAMRDYVHENSGFITSEARTNLIRFECELASELPTLLQRKGYDVAPAGSAERLLPITETITEHGGTRKIARQHIAPTAVSVFEFKLPFGS